MSVCPGFSLTFYCFVVYSKRRFVLCLNLVLFCSCVFSPFSIAITSLGEERANLSAFRAFVRFVLVWFNRFPLPLGVWKGLRFVIVALPGIFSYPFLLISKLFKNAKRPYAQIITCSLNATSGNEKGAFFLTLAY